MYLQFLNIYNNNNNNNNTPSLRSPSAAIVICSNIDVVNIDGISLANMRPVTDLLFTLFTLYFVQLVPISRVTGSSIVLFILFRFLVLAFYLLSLLSST
jgi:hypothetical protein